MSARNCIYLSLQATCLVLILTFKLSAEEPKQDSVQKTEKQSIIQQAETVPNPQEDAATAQEPYIPKNLDECFVRLMIVLQPADLAEIKNTKVDELARFHHSLGQDLRNNWGLWAGSRLAVWFAERGIWHPDSMSGIILKQYWRYLHDLPIEYPQKD